MTTILLVGGLLLLFAFQSFFCKLYSDRYPGEKDVSSFVYSVFYGVFVAAVTLIFSGFAFHPTGITWLLGIANAAVLFGYNLFLIQASSCGSYSMVMIFCLFGGILLPMAESILWFDGKLEPVQYVAIGLMLVSFLFLNSDGIKERKKGTRRFYVYCALLFLANGLYGALMNTQQTLMNNAQRSEMIIVTYLFSAVFAFGILVIKRKRNAFHDFRQTRQSGLLMVVCGVVAACAINLDLYLLSLIDVSILYTVDNGGVLLLSILFSILFFHEKPTVPKTIGMLLSATSMVLLSL